MISAWHNSENIHIIVDPMTDSNCYLIRQGDHCFIIDPNDFFAIQSMLQKWNMSPEMILLTHAHCDHTAALNDMRQVYPEATVIASSLCSEALQNRHANMSGMMTVYLYYKTGKSSITPYEAFTCQPADVTFEDTFSINFHEETVVFQRIPGHSAGSCAILYDGCIFCGDYLLPGETVVTRLPGGNEQDYETYAKPWLQQIPDGTHIYPGHGAAFYMNEEVRRAHDL